jgi:hypothetical protein
MHRNHRHERCRHAKIARAESARRHDADRHLSGIPDLHRRRAAGEIVRLGSHRRPPGGVALFIGLAMLFQTLAVTFLGPLFPRFFKNAYEPLFYDATLSFGEKIARWRVQPPASLQLLTTVMMLSLLAVAVVSRG